MAKMLGACKVTVFAFVALCCVTIATGSHWQPKSPSQRGRLDNNGQKNKLTSQLSYHESDEKLTSVLDGLDRGGGAEDGKATIAASVFNLVNNVAGAGILTLSAAMASGTGWFPAIAICAILGAMSAHCFSMIGTACELTGEGDFKVCSSQLIPCSKASKPVTFLIQRSLSGAFQLSGSLGSNDWRKFDNIG